MIPNRLLSMILAGLLVATAALIVSSRVWMQEAHRELERAQKERLRLLDQEQALQVEWAYRTGLNTVERRARQELGMDSPRPDQWRIWQNEADQTQR
ncbi:MAG: cell division protein FtsL [Magnetococcales bacterium]|nr:cell division protein FtsL [Magnetococcales bacterium]